MSQGERTDTAYNKAGTIVYHRTNSYLPEKLDGTVVEQPVSPMVTPTPPQFLHQHSSDIESPFIQPLSPAQSATTVSSPKPPAQSSSPQLSHLGSHASFSSQGRQSANIQYSSPTIQPGFASPQPYSGFFPENPNVSTPQDEQENIHVSYFPSQSGVQQSQGFFQQDMSQQNIPRN